MPEVSLPDLIAISWFLLLWSGYTLYSDRVDGGGRNLVATMALHREMWMVRMLGRDNRMLDIQIIRNLTRTSSFFASTSILILAGLVTVLGAAEKAVDLTASIPFVSKLTSLQWELRLLCLILIFIYSFFKFAWSIRQISYCAIQIGAMDPVSDLGTTARYAQNVLPGLPLWRPCISTGDCAATISPWRCWPGLSIRLRSALPRHGLSWFCIAVNSIPARSKFCTTAVASPSRARRRT